MIIIGDDASGISEVQHHLSQHFEMKDLGHPSYFPGLEVSNLLKDITCHKPSMHVIYFLVLAPLTKK